MRDVQDVSSSATVPLTADLISVQTGREPLMEGTMTTQGAAPNPSLVAFCGLYCGECGSFKKGRCPGCAENTKASWCKIRSCNMERGYKSCAECTEFSNPTDCRKFHNFMAKIFGVLFNSDRAACIAKLKELGLDGYAEFMVRLGRQSIPRR